MGYIAPVTNYQYTQYAERELKNSYDPFHIVPVGRIKSAENTHSEKTLTARAGSKKTIKKKRSEIDKVRNKSKVDEMYRELTGKGRYFDECV